MSGREMLSLTFGVGVLTVSAAVLITRFRARTRLWALLSLLFRFSCLLIGVSATAYWSTAPGGPHPVSACASAFLLLAYVVSSEPEIRS